MNKEEILEKSRHENKNRDISEISQTKDASRFAIIFSLAFYIIYSTLTMIAHKPLNKGIAAMETCVMFAVYLHKSIKTRKSEHILCAVLMGEAFLMFSFVAIMELFKK
ncbi:MULTISPECIES: DUF6442 family protein [Ruminococcus]|uniref:Uncharacterized protein n=1 Tax=Ruminococcus flavefaciens TaxID=1265 RepID=A0A1M7L7Q5_RUMFL|nr:MULTISPECIES: DUF6442 family protein [Ruminococcus]MCR4796704.1 DUF6442 family protein [Ruminococcus sp.]SHM74187.1 hypothetical protein SAMN04487860_11232 [Ruminococcus flavefaciens]